MTTLVPALGNQEAPTLFAPAERASVGNVGEASNVLASQGLLCLVLDTMPEMVFLLNQHRQILFANQAARVYAAGRGVDGFLGQRPGEFLSCRVAAKAPGGCGTGEECRTCGAVQAILQAGDGRRCSKECRILTAENASALDLAISASPLAVAGIPLILVVAADISDAKRRRVLERLFFHDVLNCAGGIKGIADLLCDGTVTGSEIADDLQSVSSELITEIQSQRTLMAAETGELVPQIQGPYHSIEVLASVLRGYRNHPVCRDRAIELSPDSEGFEFHSDLSLLSRVLGNLAKNALEASAAGERVTLGCRRLGTEILFWCHNLKAMPREVQLQLFQRSFSTKGVGRGIGTYSVKLLTERYLQGRVRFESSEEKGTTFTLAFPLQPAASDSSSKSS